MLHAHICSRTSHTPCINSTLCSPKPIVGDLIFSWRLCHQSSVRSKYTRSIVLAMSVVFTLHLSIYAISVRVWVSRQIDRYLWRCFGCGGLLKTWNSLLAACAAGRSRRARRKVVIRGGRVEPSWSIHQEKCECVFEILANLEVCLMVLLSLPLHHRLVRSSILFRGCWLWYLILRKIAWALKRFCELLVDTSIW